MADRLEKMIEDTGIDGNASLAPGTPACPMTTPPAVGANPNPGSTTHDHHVASTSVLVKSVNSASGSADHLRQKRKRYFH